MNKQDRQRIERLGRDEELEQTRGSEDLPNFLAPQEGKVEPEQEPESLQLPVTQAETMAELATRLAMQSDFSRMSAGVALLNTFNYAVQQQGKRNEWNEDDFRSFLIALAAMDAIGAKTLENEIQEAMKRRQS